MTEAQKSLEGVFKTNLFMAPQTPLVKNLPEKAGDARGKGRSLGCVDACRGPAPVDPG